MHIKGLMLNDDMHAESVRNGGTYYSYYSSFSVSIVWGSLNSGTSVQPELVDVGKWESQ